jgi:hypothetical protein
MAFTFDSQGKIVVVTGPTPRNTVEKEFTLHQSMGGVQAGERVMLAVAPVDVSQSVELENYMGGYTQSGYIQDIISPIVPCDAEEFKRRDFSHTNVFSPVDDHIGRSGAINEIEHASGLITNKTEEHALAAFIGYAAENDAASHYNVRAAHAKMIRDKLFLNREIRVLDKLTTLGTWAAANRTTITSTLQWDGGASKDPLADLRAYIAASWGPITGIAMNLDVCGYLLADTKVKAYADFQMGTANTKPGAMLDANGVSEVQIVKLPGLPPIYVTQAKKYVSGTMTTILADDVILFNAPTVMSGGDTLATALSFRYRGRSGTGFTVNEYQPVGRGLNGGTMLECGFADGDVIPGIGDSSACRIGGLIKSVLTGT